jgi:hypothetical protein
MRKYRDVVLDPAGNALGQATVTVSQTVGGADAVLYADADGLNQLESNVLLTQADGSFEFYVEDGRYNISVVKGGVSASITDVEIIDSAVFASQIATLQTYAHTVSGTTDQVNIVADVNGNLTLSTPQSIATDSDPQFRDLTVRHLLGGTLPVIASWGTGAGASAPTTPPTFTLTGDGLCFVLRLTPSASPASLATIVTFAFSQTFAAAPIIAITPGNPRTGNLQSGSASGAAFPDGTITTTGAAFLSNVTALTAGQEYIWIFTVHGA